MDKVHPSIPSVPFDPDFDARSDQASGQVSNPKGLSGMHPLMAFYTGLACSVLVFGLVGIILLLTLNN